MPELSRWRKVARITIAQVDELLPGSRFERFTALPSEDRPHG